MKKSVVIPTLWRSREPLRRMLDIYEASPYVGEVIIIDNNPDARPRLAHSKVRILTRGENIYVNPAWNWGAAQARYELVLANDDIELARLDELIEAVAAVDFDIVGACNWADEGEIVVEEVDDMPGVSPYNRDWSCGYGAMMFVRDYVPIPDSMKIYYGDNFLVDHAGRKGMFHGLKFVNPSATAERTSEWDQIKKRDERAYLKSLDERRSRLSVAMIVKNEGEHLKNCLDSLRDADEIVIVDTGSSDNTMALAREYTDKVYGGERYRWRDDFAFSRNQALAKCTQGNWVLSMDADETLEPGGMRRLKDLVGRSEQRGVALRLVAAGSGDVHYVTRLFRKLPGVSWNEPIHEVINVMDAEKSDVSIRYGHSRAHADDPGRSLRILRKAVETEPENSRRRYYLAREYWYAGDFERACYHFDYYTRIGSWAPELADGLLMKPRCLWQLQRGHEARGACLEAIRMNPNFKEALMLMAEMHHEPWKARWASFAELADNSDVLFIRV